MQIQYLKLQRRGGGSRSFSMSVCSPLSVSGSQPPEPHAHAEQSRALLREHFQPPAPRRSLARPHRTRSRGTPAVQEEHAGVFGLQQKGSETSPSPVSPSEPRVPEAAEPLRLRTGPLCPPVGGGTAPGRLHPAYLPPSDPPSQRRPGRPGDVRPSVRPSAGVAASSSVPRQPRSSRRGRGMTAPPAGLRSPRGDHGPPPLPAGAGGAAVAVGVAVGAAPAAGPPRAAPPGRRSRGQAGTRSRPRSRPGPRGRSCPKHGRACGCRLGRGVRSRHGLPRSSR